MSTESFLLGAITILLLLTFTLLVVLVRRTNIDDALAAAWMRLGVDRHLGEIKVHADDIKGSYRSLEQMLRVPTERAALGEISLEMILANQLPKDMYGIREKCIDGKIPDAHIKAPEGMICIDSKFPLDNYAKLVNEPDIKLKDQFKRTFVRDVREHLKKIAQDYINPQAGTAEFAFAYIPAESVYYFLVTEAYELLQEFARKGIQSASPLTLAHKIELLKLGVRTLRLNEKAQEVKKSLDILGRRFDKIDDLWSVFYGTHLKNLAQKSGEIEAAYKKLRDDFLTVKGDIAV